MCRYTHLHLALRLRTTGAVPPLFLYDLMLYKEAVYLLLYQKVMISYFPFPCKFKLSFFFVVIREFSFTDYKL